MSHADLRFAPAAIPADLRRAELVDLVSRHAPADGLHETAIAPLQLIRASAPAQALPAVYEPSLCFVVQGSKQARLGAELFRYDPLHYLVVSFTLPVVGRIIEAAEAQPYLCARLSVDPGDIVDMAITAPRARALAPHADASPTSQSGLRIARVSDALLDAVLRLLRLLNAPHDIPVLAPLAVREICYRVLNGELGARLRELAAVDGHGRRIARAIELIKRRYAEPIRTEELAAAAHMSVSSLHHHFKRVTARSPLQYQKQLRLHQARRLMMAEGLEAGAAGHRVGYESASQFSRDYRGLFGAPPRAQVHALRTAPAPEG